MDEALELLKEIFKDVPQVTDKTPKTRLDKIDQFKVYWYNGVDIRVSIDTLKKVQDLLKDT